MNESAYKKEIERLLERVSDLNRSKLLWQNKFAASEQKIRKLNKEFSDYKKVYN